MCLSQLQRTWIPRVLICWFLISFPGLVAGSDDLTSLYTTMYAGADHVHVPSQRFDVRASSTRVADIQLDAFPFTWGTIQAGFEWPQLANDNATSFYLRPPQSLADDPSAALFSLVIGKAGQTSGRVAITDKSRVLETQYGYPSDFQGFEDQRLSVVLRSWSYYAKLTGESLSYRIVNPKDLGNQKGMFFLTGLANLESQVARATRNLKIVVYSREEHVVLKEVLLPFTNNYLPLLVYGLVPIQSVIDSRYVYLVLREPTTSAQKTSPWYNPHTFHFMIYDWKDDMLYSVWHELKDNPGDKRVLSFHYYLGKEGLYFQTLREDKTEIFLLEIDWSNRQPMSSYVTVDLLWDSELEKLWQQQIYQARLNNRGFKSEWR